MSTNSDKAILRRVLGFSVLNPIKQRLGADHLKINRYLAKIELGIQREHNKATTEEVFTDNGVR